MVVHALLAEQAPHDAPEQNRWLPHDSGVDQARHPLLSAAHVCTFEPLHCVAPLVEHAPVAEQAVHALPLQDCWPPHAVAVDQLRHPAESTPQVCTFVPLHWVAPTLVQALVGEQLVVHPLPLQTCPAPHDWGADQTRHRDGPTSQSSTDVPTHRVCMVAHSSVQLGLVHWHDANKAMETTAHRANRIATSELEREWRGAACFEQPSQQLRIAARTTATS